MSEEIHGVSNKQKKHEEPTTSASPHGVVPCGFAWRSRARIWKIPLISVAYGRDDNGKIRVAKGLIAIGRYAVGGIAVGQFALGFLAIGQLAVGVVPVGQFVLAAVVGFGQFAVGPFAVGQFVAGVYGRGQFGWATYLWSPGRTDMEAVAMFETIEWLFQRGINRVWQTIASLFG